MWIFGGCCWRPPTASSVNQHFIHDVDYAGCGKQVETLEKKKSHSIPDDSEKRMLPHTILITAHSLSFYSTRSFFCCHKVSHRRASSSRQQHFSLMINGNGGGRARNDEHKRRQWCESCCVKNVCNFSPRIILARSNVTEMAGASESCHQIYTQNPASMRIRWVPHIEFWAFYYPEREKSKESKSPNTKQAKQIRATVKIPHQENELAHLPEIIFFNLENLSLLFFFIHSTFSAF